MGSIPGRSSEKTATNCLSDCIALVVSNWLNIAHYSYSGELFSCLRNNCRHFVCLKKCGWKLLYSRQRHPTREIYVSVFVLRLHLEVNKEKTEYMLLSLRQNAGQYHDIRRANRYPENVAQSRYFGTAVTDQNLIQEKIKRRLNSDNDCYNWVQNLLSSRLLSKNI
jgi:hypothetical protein